ncbi:MAG: NADPH-dependent FMN reductase [Ilumatobacteraceae bacterium]
MKIGLWCASLGQQSANAALLRIAAGRIKELGHESLALINAASIPAFDPALVDDPPMAVADLRRQLRNCDAVAIASPEYAAGVAGSMKNALDWLVGDSTIYRTVIGVASAGTTGGQYAIEQMIRTISWQGGWTVAAVGISAPRSKSDGQGEFTDDTTIEDITSWIDAIVGAAAGSPDDRRALVAATVNPYGIDMDRFGQFE